MSYRFLKSEAGRWGDHWPVFLLVVVVMIPTIGVLWFVSVATRNEQLAGRQRLTDAYRSNLAQVQQRLDLHWKQITTETLSDVSVPLSSDREGTQQRFDAAVQSERVDSAICFSPDGTVTYPDSPAPVTTEFEDPLWQKAWRVEYQDQDAEAALQLYRQIATQSDDEVSTAFARQGEVRCLLKVNQFDSAIGVVVDQFAGPLSNVRDAQGRVIAANVELMTMENVISGTEIESVRNQLLGRLPASGEERLPSTQRVFLMHRIMEFSPALIDRQLLAAEELAARFVAVHPRPSRETFLQPSQIPGVWQISTADRRMLLLLRTETVQENSLSAAGAVELPAGVTLAVDPPRLVQTDGELISLQAGAMLPGWRLTLFSDDPAIGLTAVHHRTLYHWISVLVVFFTTAMTVFVVISFRRQIQVANLKNDLVGTVSHELKTPLSSIRLLVDTLLDSETLDTRRTREYLQLIAKENTRLSRLIENFLTFSRLEKGNYAFEFQRIDVEQLVSRTVEAAGDRFQAPGCSLSVNVDPHLPTLRGDADGLMTALLNYLDNAYKYSTEPRKLVLEARLDEGQVCFSVSDNGVGLSRTASRHVFQKFFQVDQSLVRQGRGCGLGLSIVNSIVRAHGGDVSVSSPGDGGSTFSFRIPVEFQAKT